MLFYPVLLLALSGCAVTLAWPSKQRFVDVPINVEGGALVECQPVELSWDGSKLPPDREYVIYAIAKWGAVEEGNIVEHRQNGTMFEVRTAKNAGAWDVNFPAGTIVNFELAYRYNMSWTTSDWGSLPIIRQDRSSYKIQAGKSPECISTANQPNFMRSPKVFPLCEKVHFSWEDFSDGSGPYQVVVAREYPVERMAMSYPDLNLDNYTSNSLDWVVNFPVGSRMYINAAGEQGEMVAEFTVGEGSSSACIPYEHIYVWSFWFHLRYPGFMLMVYKELFPYWCQDPVFLLSALLSSAVLAFVGLRIKMRRLMTLGEQPWGKDTKR